MKKIRITQIKSGIDRPERQKLTLKALGLNKMNASREVEPTAQILGMVRAVNHLIQVEEVEVDETNLDETRLEEPRSENLRIEEPLVNEPVHEQTTREVPVAEESIEESRS